MWGHVNLNNVREATAYSMADGSIELTFKEHPTETVRVKMTPELAKQFHLLLTQELSISNRKSVV